jgi:hypothetical protein
VQVILFRKLAVYDEADDETDWAALQYQYIQASLAAELAIQQLTAFHGAHFGSHISDRYEANYQSNIQPASAVPDTYMLICYNK